MKKETKKIPENIMAALVAKENSIIKKWLTKENVDFLDSENRSLLHNAILQNNEDLCLLLIKFGANLNLKDKIGFAPLHYIAQNNLLNLGLILLENDNVDLEIKDNFGNTPLGRATFSYRGNGDLISLFLKKGANPNNKNLNDISPKDLANNISNYDVKKYFNE